MNKQKSPSPGLKQQSKYTLYDQLLVFGLFLFCIIFLFTPVKSRAGTLGEDFSSDKNLKIGSLVSLKKDTPKEVELSNVENSEYLLGVVTNSQENSVSYSKDSAEVSIALSGEVEVFATDVNGQISKGDFIGASWLEGVGMKADFTSEQKLLGVAMEDYDIKTAKEYGEIDTPSGKKEATVQSLKVRLFERDNSQTTSSMSSVEKILSRIAGKNVSVIKIAVCLVIFLIGIVTAGFFVSSSIKGSFISIGRNPLASSSIYRSLVHVTTMSVAIILIGAALAYVVLAV